MRLYTIGHSTHEQAKLIALLQAAGVALLVDVRSFPRSRTNPQFNADELARALAAVEIGYRHQPALGGRRGRQDLGYPSPNGLWRVEAFRNYADHALSPAFQSALDALLTLAAAQPTAVMCAEADWHRCHRRLITDNAIARGCEVVHLLADGKSEAGVLTPGAVPQPDGRVHYPPPQGELF